MISAATIQPLEKQVLVMAQEVRAFTKNITAKYLQRRKEIIDGQALPFHFRR
jgi:hypothetical protein